MDFKSLPQELHPFHFSHEEQQHLLKMITTGNISLVDGGILDRFELQSAELFGNVYGIALYNGSSAIYLALKGCGVGPGTEVILPTYGFHGAAVTICVLGATPIFCDIDPDTLTLDISDTKSLISPQTKAILALHPWGNIANIDGLCQIRSEKGIALISDSSHCHGSTWKNKPLGSYFDVTAASYGMNKLISGGELGVATTDNPDIRDDIYLNAHVNRITKKIENPPDGVTNAVGIKMRPHALALQIALYNMVRFQAYIKVMRHNYDIFTARAISSFPLRPVSVLPQAQRSYWKPVFFYDQNGMGFQRLERFLLEKGYPLEKHNYLKPLHNNPIFSQYYSVPPRDSPFTGFNKIAHQLIHIPHALFLDPITLDQVISTVW